MTGERTEFDVGQVVSYWLIEADEALRVADHLVEKTDYSYALFFGHLAAIQEVFQWLRSLLP
jgi:hypothetical protein